MRHARLPRAQRRQQITDEATRIIGQRGYYGFSMQELADSCGLTVAGLLRRIVERNSTQPELVRLYSMLRAESLYPGHPAHAYFKTRDEMVLAAFTRLFDGLAGHPASMARQLLALMCGLEGQWLHNPDTMDLVQEWDRAMETIATSVTS